MLEALLSCLNSLQHRWDQILHCRMSGIAQLQDFSQDRPEGKHVPYSCWNPTAFPKNLPSTGTIQQVSSIGLMISPLTKNKNQKKKQSGQLAQKKRHRRPVVTVIAPAEGVDLVHMPQVILQAIDAHQRHTPRSPRAGRLGPSKTPEKVTAPVGPQQLFPKKRNASTHLQKLVETPKPVQSFLGVDGPFT